jgi:hypothetical protein
VVQRDSIRRRRHVGRRGGLVRMDRRREEGDEADAEEEGDEAEANEDDDSSQRTSRDNKTGIASRFHA